MNLRKDTDMEVVKLLYFILWYENRYFTYHKVVCKTGFLTPL